MCGSRCAIAVFVGLFVVALLWVMRPDLHPRAFALSVVGTVLMCALVYGTAKDEINPP